MNRKVAVTIIDNLQYNGQSFGIEYNDVDSFEKLPHKNCRQVYGLCFYKGSLVIGYNGAKQTWGLVGGTIEPGESFRQTLDREVQEESNMQVLAAKPIGYQKVTGPDGQVIYQLRYWARVEPYGDFVADPAGSVTAIKLISPTTHKSYFDWGRIGERLIERAIELNQAK
ncbi:MAG TPA: NUDIX domain-containing protein [Patescibacteria group bacterium]|nr:NUDIX domain-containing protein [Patescibacteria group bacterium]